ncbi:MAG: RsfA family transcriptional regulator [Firmicutes bacterium]|nr:RsfA family transcriptional regulator [Bacillota bacterium]
MELMERWASRSDAWTPEDDVTLAELVLKHIREGSTQLIAFDEAASLLGRTSAACGYRWNGVVRRHYDEAIREAKQVRRKALEERRNRRPNRTQIMLGENHEFTLDLLIRGLRDFERRYHELSDEIVLLSSEKDALETRLALAESLHVQGGHHITLPPATPEQIEEDSRALLAIMERARKLLEQDTSQYMPAFMQDDPVDTASAE